MPPKAVLYYNPASVWSRAALLALREKGYGKDEVDLRVVDTTKGEEFSPAMLRLNPKATLPALVVPLQGTLGADIETRFKVIADPKALVNFLDRSRSTVSRSHSTSSAPAPSLSPATVASATISSNVVDTVYSDAVAPELLYHFSSRDVQSLQALAMKLVPVLDARKRVLVAHLADCEREVIKMSEKTRAFWTEKKHEIDVLLQQLSASNEVHTEEYFTVVKQVWERAVPEALVKLSSEIIGPYVLGDQISVADIHLSAWLVHVVVLSGGSCADSGETALKRVEQQAGLRRGSVLGLAIFWDAMRRRPGWGDVFAYM